MEPLYSRILESTRRGLLGSKRIFRPFAPASDIHSIEAQIGTELPESLVAWLEAAGYGDINDVLSFRRDWFSEIDRGNLKGHVIFAQDELGNFYSFSPKDGSIHLVRRSAPEFAQLAPDFRSFLEELERRSFKLQEWTDSVDSQPYDWST